MRGRRRSVIDAVSRTIRDALSRRSSPALERRAPALFGSTRDDLRRDSSAELRSSRRPSTGSGRLLPIVQRAARPTLSAMRDKSFERSFSLDEKTMKNQISQRSGERAFCKANENPGVLGVLPFHLVVGMS